MVRGWDLLGADITNARLQPHTVHTLDVFTPDYRYTVLIAQRLWMHFHLYFNGPWDEAFVYMSTLESAMIHAKNRSSCHLLPPYVQRRIDLIHARRRGFVALKECSPQPSPCGKTLGRAVTGGWHGCSNAPRHARQALLWDGIGQVCGCNHTVCPICLPARRAIILNERHCHL